MAHTDCTQYWGAMSANCKFEVLCFISLTAQNVEGYIQIRINFIDIFYVYWTVHHCDSWRKTNLMSLAILFHFLCAQHVSDINTSNTHRTKNNTTNVVIQQNSRKLLMMDILMSETCWAHKKWNKIASDIRLVFYSLISMFTRASSEYYSGPI